MDFQMVKGSVSMMVLGLLYTSDMYGYQMIQELSKRSGQSFDFKEGTLYPVLYELEKKEYIESYCERTVQKRKRRYYHLTEKGQMKLHEKISDWKCVIQSVNEVLDSLDLKEVVHE